VEELMEIFTRSRMGGGANGDIYEIENGWRS